MTVLLTSGTREKNGVDVLRELQRIVRRRLLRHVVVVVVVE